MHPCRFVYNSACDSVTPVNISHLVPLLLSSREVVLMSSRERRMRNLGKVMTAGIGGNKVFVHPERTNVRGRRREVVGGGRCTISVLHYMTKKQYEL